MKKRLMCLILALSIMFGGMNVFADAEKNGLRDVTEDDLITTEIRTNYSREDDSLRLFSISNRDELYNEIYNAIKEKKDSLDVSQYNVSFTDDNELFSVVVDVIRDNPELYYAKTSYYSRYNDLTLTIKDIFFFYTDYTSNEDAENFFTKVNYIIASTVHEGMTDEEKALVLHDYIVNNTTYYSIDGSVEPPYDIYTSYMVLMNHTGVCQGYALAYNLLLNRVGIETRYVSSDAMKPNHGWSMIKLDGQWYHVDTTWDDPIISSGDGETTFQEVWHDNFLRSDVGITETGHHGWDSRLPECLSTKYESDEYCFYGSKDVIKYKDGRFYSYCLVEVPERPDEACKYSPITEKYYVDRWYSSEFCGDKTRISQEDFDAVVEEEKEMYKPIKMTDKVIHYAPLSELASSEIYLKTNDTSSDNYSVIICFYDDENRLISSATAAVEQFDGFVKITPSNVPSGAVSAKLMYWMKNMVLPLSNSVTVK